ncbi:MAG: hypothetical protein J0M04_14695 [Verrucomicrobia bacterium]|nr:hypothetical protein [Verrucomicrobiota bacterium]
MKTLPLRIAIIRVTWIYPETDEVYFYRDLEGSIEQSADRIGFWLRCTHGDEDDFTATLWEIDGKLRLRFDSNVGPEDLLMRKAESPGEIILCHESLRQVVYFHLTPA